MKTELEDRLFKSLQQDPSAWFVDPNGPGSWRIINRGRGIVVVVARKTGRFGVSTTSGACSGAPLSPKACERVWKIVSPWTEKAVAEAEAKRTREAEEFLDRALP
jgi:hypothetical protein